MRLLLIRHGQTQGNIANHLQGDDDPLTDLGREQAGATARWLAANEHITHLYCSPLARALETATVIGREIGHEPTPLAGLAELNIGVAAGTPFDTWAADNPQHLTQLGDPTTRMDFLWEGGEDGHVFRDRVFGAWDHLITAHVGTPDVVAAISHGGALAWLAAKVQDLPTTTWPNDIFNNLSISEIDIDAGGTPTVVAWNRLDHLDAAGVEVT